MSHYLYIQDTLSDHLSLTNRVIADAKLQDQIHTSVENIVTCFRNGNKVLLCGNGGSAADAQHIAAEWQGRYLMERRPLFAEALHVNTSYLTAVANDYGFEHVYARAVEAQAQPGDILIALSTSGNSPNICKALQMAKTKGMIRIGFTGENKDTCLVANCDILINIPSRITARIQEMHMLIAHIICEETEKQLFS
ncbi:MAG TPA: SIS domain-containing protein [Saprospiraceae bacterium]|nr:SIS domain-containing protein [Saprospiraceae bacterium]